MKELTKNAGTRLAHTTNKLCTDDIVINLKDGIAYQVDRTKSVPYDKAYFDKTAGKTLKKPINEFRRQITDLYAEDKPVLDFGCGDCSFIDERPNTWGYDINPHCTLAAMDRKKFHDIHDGLEPFYAITFWDSFEHLPEPKNILKYINTQYVIMTIPIIKDLTKLKQWKHYRPNEHYWYFTDKGLEKWMKTQGFKREGYADGEIRAGRLDTPTYIFRR